LFVTAARGADGRRVSTAARQTATCTVFMGRSRKPAQCDDCLLTKSLPLAIA